MNCLTDRRLSAVILLLCLSCFLSGCWNRRELNTLGFMGMVGVDKSDKHWQSTIEVIKPQKGGGEQTATTVKYVQTTAETSFSSFRNATLKMDRRIFSTFARVWIFGENAAENIAIFDHFFRDHEVRLATPLFIAQGASAAEVMGIAGGVQTQPSGYLEDLWKNQKFNGKSISITALDFIKAYLIKGKNPGGQKQEYELTTEGAAVFVKSHLVGFLDGTETRGYNWVESKDVDWTIISSLPGAEDRLAIEIHKIHRNKEVELVDGKIKLKVNLMITGKVGEITGVADLANPATLALLEQASAESIKAEVKHTLTKLQREYRSDIFGFGQVMHRKYPREWKDMQDNWDEFFAAAETEVTVQVSLTQTGKNHHTIKK
jgi:spore germination protein KC